MDGDEHSVPQNPDPPGRRTPAPRQLLLLGEQTTPNLPSLRLLHTSADGYVSFSRKVNGEFRDVGAVPVAKLNDDMQPWLPGLLAKLAQDSYFTINGMYRAGRRLRPRERYVPTVIEGQHVRELKTVATVERYVRGSGGLRFAYRASEGVRWLTAAWVDCDGYRQGLDAPATVAGLMRAWRDAVIPVPSFMVTSGRGAWAFWKLLDERNPTTGCLAVDKGGKTLLYPDSPVRASSLAVRFHRAINNALAARLAHLGGDGAACDVARTCRVPGSYHSGADAHVEILPVLRDGMMAVYTLSDLAQWLNLGDTLVSSTRALKAGATLSDAQLAQRLRAFQARHRRVFEAILSLSERRGGFSEGHRHLAVFHCAVAGFRAAVEAESVQQRVRRMVEHMHPPMTPRDTDAALRSAFRKADRRAKPARYDTIAADLGMSADERIAVGLVRRERKTPRLGASSRRALVREIVTSALSLGQGVPSGPEMVRLLAARGVGVSQPTVAADYRVLGISSGRRGGRPRPLLRGNL